MDVGTAAVALNSLLGAATVITRSDVTNTSVANMQQNNKNFLIIVLQLHLLLLLHIAFTNCIYSLNLNIRNQFRIRDYYNRWNMTF